MPKGPAPSSKADLKKRGSWRAKVRADDLELPGVTLDPAQDMDADALDEWARVVGALAPRGVITDVDRAALTILCMSWSCWIRSARAEAAAEAGSVEWRQYGIAKREAFAAWLPMAQRFGLTPADRPRVKLPKSAGKNDKSKFFGKPKLAS